jgi:hypothetical protein
MAKIFFESKFNSGEKIAFIEEATQFVKMLKQMKRRPIIPSAKLFGVELAQDIKIFNDLLAEENKIDISAATKASNKTELLGMGNFE